MAGAPRFTAPDPPGARPPRRPRPLGPSASWHLDGAKALGAPGALRGTPRHEAAGRTLVRPDTILLGVFLGLVVSSEEMLGMKDRRTSVFLLTFFLQEIQVGCRSPCHHSPYHHEQGFMRFGFVQKGVFQKDQLREPCGTLAVMSPVV